MPQALFLIGCSSWQRHLPVVSTENLTCELDFPSLFHFEKKSKKQHGRSQKFAFERAAITGIHGVNSSVWFPKIQSTFSKWFSGFTASSTKLIPFSGFLASIFASPSWSEVISRTQKSIQKTSNPAVLQIGSIYFAFLYQCPYQYDLLSPASKLTTHCHNQYR